MKLVLLVTILCALWSVSKCHRQKRITLGEESKPHSRPYQVHNILMMKDGNVEICGGALISKSFVLTAAHCFKDSVNLTQIVVIMGAHNLTEEEKEIQITDNYIIHNDYKHLAEGYGLNDIALIKLPKPARLTKNIQLVSLPKKSQVNESFTGKQASIAGWGKTETYDTSDVLLEGISEIHEEYEFCKLPNSVICTFAIQGVPCTGDSGSPLIFNNTVIGVLSAGYCYMFSYYTRISSFLDWIEQHSDVKILD